MDTLTGLLPLAGSVLAASLVGSPHCAGMCGGFVCFYSVPGDDPGARATLRRVLPHVAYNGGRLLVYVALGAVAGAIGAGVDRMGAAAGIGRGAAILAGVLMILWGVMALLAALGARVPGAARLAATGAPVARVLRAVRAQPPALRALIVGLLSVLLPCGWLYAFAATAAGTGSPVTGAVVMAAFWTGSLPVMTGVGVAAQGLFGPLRRRLPAITASALIVIGLLTVAGRFQPGRAQGQCHSGAHVPSHAAPDVPGARGGR